MIKLNNSKKIGVAMCAFLSLGMFAQTAEEAKIIQKANDLHRLEKIKKDLAKKPSIEELRLIAKSQDIPFRGEIAGRTYQFQGFDLQTNTPLYYITNNMGAAIGTGTNMLYQSKGIFNLDGQNMMLHEWDGGAVRVSHQEFDGRVVQADGSETISDHATHVAGTLVAAGHNPESRGMAFRANLRAYDWTDDMAEVAGAVSEGALVSNHSYGFLGGYEWTNLSGRTGWHWLGADEDTEFKLFGKYSTFDRGWDAIALSAPYYLHVKAAGNPRGSGPEDGAPHYVRIERDGGMVWETSTRVRQKNGGVDGFDTINHSALGKNILTVGAVHKLVAYNNVDDVRMTSFSAFGPADDGRVKPDIVGVGQGVLSTVASADTAYSSISGTSMASPNVTGSLILLQQHHNQIYGSYMKAATLKALVINTAKEAGNIGPDYKFGWGLLDAFKAAQILSVKDKLSIVEERTLNNGMVSSIDMVADGAEPLKITMVWADPVSELMPLPDTNILNDRTRVLVNDLDIRVLKDGQEFFPWILDPSTPNTPATKGDNVVDNVEQIVIENPEAGATYRLIVSHKNNLHNNDSQDFSVVVSGIKQNLDYDLDLKEVRIDALPDAYTVNTPVHFTYENKGTKNIPKAKIIYKLINKDSNTVEKEGSFDIANLPVGESSTTIVDIDLSKSFVNYEVVGEVDYIDDGIDINNKAFATAFGVTANLTEKGSIHRYGFEDEFTKNGWVAEDVNGDNKTWHIYEAPDLAYEGNHLSLNFPGNTIANDWMFSNPLKLKAGVSYLVSFYSRKFTTGSENLSLHLGNRPASEAMDINLSQFVDLTTNYTNYRYEFTADRDGIHYLGFHHETEQGRDTSYAVSIDDVLIKTVEGKPFAEFKVNKLNPNTYETVAFTDNSITGSTRPINKYNWKFSPDTVTFVENTTLDSQNPKVVFNDQVPYTVALTVTNADGSDVMTKENIISPQNTETVAKFTINRTKISPKGSILFSNLSTGNPTPHKFKWTVTPSDGVEFLGDGDESKDVAVKFNKEGLYTVSLEATSFYNTSVETKREVVEVSSKHGTVRELKGSYNADDKSIELTWERPILLPIYEEGFEGVRVPSLPPDMRIIDNNNDRKTWRTSQNDKSSGANGAVSFSWERTSGAFDVDDWLITPKISAGAEILEFAMGHPLKERYDVFLVEAPEDGTVLTPELIRAGEKILSDDAESVHSQFVLFTIDIKDFTNKDFHIAFLHRTKKEDDGFILALDDLKVGYKNSISKSVTEKNNTSFLEELGRLKSDFVSGNRLLTPKDFQLVENNHPNDDVIIVPFAITGNPKLTGYQISKNGEVIGEVNAEGKSYLDPISTQGEVTYGVEALYSDHAFSEIVTVVVDTSLSTNEVATLKKIKIYPNPSDGLFTVENTKLKGKLILQVFDMSGKMVENKVSNTTKTELDLRKYPKGVYILNVSDENANRESVKLIIK
ncbi:MAG: S8 family serine peptidase [Cruoricaptor ignavus]|nr:S8 family serine peptidase [Cruoricaptor ignavus]